jgi:outer membrane protein OmpA-like peptidoglycan-associated protein
LERLKRRRQSRRSTSGVGEKKPIVEVKTEEEEREKRRKEKGKRRAFS